jgi:transcription termination/antitermination protein NusG
MSKPQEVAVDVSAEKAAKPAKGKTRDMKWYVVQTQSNYEKRVHAAIKEQVLLQGFQKEVSEVLIPTEEVVEVKKGVKSTSERKFFPGYVLVKANMTDEVWHMIKNIPRVTGFVGANKGNRPLPISDKEAERILKQITEGVEKPRPNVSFDVGEAVRVTEGPFASFQGTVEEIDEAKGRLKVSVSIFGRATPIDLEFGQVEKV